MTRLDPGSADEHKAARSSRPISSMAAQLIDATAILHPELGGGTLEKKFIRLRQRLGAKR